MPIFSTSSKPAPSHMGLNEVFLTMQAVASKQPKDTTKILAKALKSVKAVSRPISAGEYLKFKGEVLGLLEPSQLKGKHRVQLEDLTMRVVATMPGTERLDAVLREARDISVKMMNKLIEQGNEGREQLRDIISALTTGRGTARVSPEVGDALDQLTRADAIASELLKRGVITVQEANSYPTVWTSLFREYGEILSQELAKITSMESKVNKAGQRAKMDCGAIKAWCKNERAEILTRWTAKIQGQVEKQLEQGVNGLSAGEWQAIAGFASLDDRAACAQAVQKFASTGDEHRFKYLQSLASRFPIADVDETAKLEADVKETAKLSVKQRAELERIYSEDHRRWVALGRRDSPAALAATTASIAALAPDTSAELEAYLGYLFDKSREVRSLEVKARELRSRKAEIQSELNKVTTAQLSGPISVNF